MGPEASHQTENVPNVPPTGQSGIPVTIRTFHVGTPPRAWEGGENHSGASSSSSGMSDSVSVEATESQKRMLRRRRAPSVTRVRRGQRPPAYIATPAEVFDMVIQIIPEGTPLQQVRDAEQICFGCCWAQEISTECYVCRALFCHDCGVKRCLCLCRTRLMYPDGRQGELEAPPTVMHNVMIR